MIQTLLSYDTNFLIAARHLVSPDGAKIIQLLGEMVVVWGAILLIAIWLYGIYMKNIGYKHIALRIFFLIMLVFIIYGIVNFGVPKWRPSPTDVVGGIAPLIPHPIDNSFPSGHALFSAALLVGLCRYLKNGWIFFFTLVITLITTTSRVIGGVHYPGDILGGFFFGWIGAILLARVVESKKFQDTVFPILLRIASWIKL